MDKIKETNYCVSVSMTKTLNNITGGKAVVAGDDMDSWDVWSRW